MAHKGPRHDTREIGCLTDPYLFEGYAWYSRCAILDDCTNAGYRPIVQMIDNFERNHKLGILMEGNAGAGKLMICTSRLSEITERPEVRQFTASVLDYMTSIAFAPSQTLDIEKLSHIFA